MREGGEKRKEGGKRRGGKCGERCSAMECFFCDEEGILSESSQFLELREARPFFRFSIVLTFTMT